VLYNDNELADLLQQPADLTFELPDPEDEGIPETEFQQQLDIAWQVCDRFDLQTEIWRGRILRAIRDREKKGGDGRGTGFLNWLKEREISKSQAYSWIQLANSADTLLQEGRLEPSAINNFSKRAFVETAKAAPEVSRWWVKQHKKAIASLGEKCVKSTTNGQRCLPICYPNQSSKKQQIIPFLRVTLHHW
jgi:hypothetical protein